MTEVIASKVLVRVINDRSRSCAFCGQAIARKAVMYFRDDLPFCSMRCESGLPGGVPCKPPSQSRLQEATKQIKIPRKPEPRIRLRLFRISPHRFWCGRAVVLEADPPNRPDLATVDHLYSRWHPEREVKHQQQKGVLHVLACRACNGERAKAEEQKRPFIPKLAERLEFAQRADATLAKGETFSRTDVRPSKGQPARLTFNMAETPTGRDLRMKVRDLG